MKIALILASILGIIVYSSTIVYRIKNSDCKSLGTGFDYFILFTSLAVYSYFLFGKLSEIF